MKNTMCYPGVDIIEIKRFQRALDRHPRLIGRLFTAAEQRELEDKHQQSWAGRFAAKEAILKALGTGLGPLSWHDVEIYDNEMGEPLVVLSPKAQEFARRRGGCAVRVSISHDRSRAVALAILT